MAPLSEVYNQVRPARRPAVYGRRRGVQAETREMHRQLFGTDENDIEKGLSKLTINSEPKQDLTAFTPPLACPEAETQSLAVQAECETGPVTKTPPNQSKSQSKAATEPEHDKKIVHRASKSGSVPVANPASQPKIVGRKPRQPLRARSKREMAVGYNAPCSISCPDFTVAYHAPRTSTSSAATFLTACPR